MKIIPYVLSLDRSHFAQSFDPQALMPRAWRYAVIGLTCLLTALRTWSADCVPPPAGLVAWWMGNESANDSAGTNNGTLSGGTTFAAGLVDQAFSFDGVNGYVKIPKSPSLNVGSQVTIEFWMRADPSTPVGSRTAGLVTSDFYGIEIGGPGQSNVGIEFYTSTDGGANFAHTSDPNGQGAVFPAGEWHHVAGTYDGSNMRLYIDGMPSGQPRFQANLISPMLANSFVTMGSEDGRTTCGSCIGNRYFKGLIDEVAIFNRALSAGEIAAIYNAGSAGKCTGPSVKVQPRSQVGYWGKSAIFTVTAAGSAPLGYQWQKDSVPIGGATGTSLVLTNLQMASAGNYSVVVTNSIGSATSSNAYLTMNPAGVSLALYSGITIDGVVGLTYGIQYNTDLSNTNGWLGKANVTLGVPTELWFDVQPASQPQRYYRVVPGPISIP